ncbi:hypothetical protein EDD86DRAFT_250232 [Gorgonomyces haynaldii]|nr:hypothetical protein EDD86DRAFT_250232 [Gorgonomyces haynaldii]
MSQRVTYLYPISAVFGFTIMEAFCCAKLLLIKASNGIPTRLLVFNVSIVSWCMTICLLVSEMIAANISPIEETPDSIIWRQYYRATQLAATISHVPEILNHAIMLHRLKHFTTRSRSYTIMLVVSIIHALAAIPNSYLGYVVCAGAKFYLHPLFNIWLLSHAGLIIVNCAINVVASILFLRQMSKMVEIPLKETIWFVMFEREGGRWIAFTVFHLFSIIATIYAGLGGNIGNITAASYNLFPHCTCF